MKSMVKEMLGLYKKNQSGSLGFAESWLLLLPLLLNTTLPFTKCIVRTKVNITTVPNEYLLNECKFFSHKLDGNEEYSCSKCHLDLPTLNNNFNFRSNHEITIKTTYFQRLIITFFYKIQTLDCVKNAHLGMHENFIYEKNTAKFSKNLPMVRLRNSYVSSLLRV